MGYFLFLAEYDFITNHRIQIPTFTGNLQGFFGIIFILSGNYLGKILTFWELSGKIW